MTKARHILVMMALGVAAMLSSCTKQVWQEGGAADENRIDFAPRALSTKGTTTDLDQLKAEGFLVNAYYTGGTPWTDALAATPAPTPNFMYNQLVEFDADPLVQAWTYSPIKYWPKNSNDKVSFFAWGPAGHSEAFAVSSNVATGFPVLTCSMTDAQACLPADLVVASSLNQSRNDSYKAPVALNFDHILARLKIKAALSPALADGTTLYVKELSISRLFMGGNYTFGIGEGELKATWTNPLERRKDAFHSLTPAVKVDDGIGKAATQTTGVDIFTGDGYVYLIPYIRTEDTALMNLKVTYELRTVDSALADGYYSSEYTKEVSLQAGLLGSGTSTALTLVFGVEAVVVEGVRVTDWDPDHQGSQHLYPN